MGQEAPARAAPEWSAPSITMPVGMPMMPMQFGGEGVKLTFKNAKITIDMIVVAKDLPSDFFERAELARKIENCPSLLQSIWMTEEEFISQFKAGAGYLLDAIQEGKIIYDMGFLRKTIPQAKRELEIQGIKRVGSAWVWPVKRLKGSA